MRGGEESNNGDERKRDERGNLTLGQIKSYGGVQASRALVVNANTPPQKQQREIKESRNHN